MYGKSNTSITVPKTYSFTPLHIYSIEDLKRDEVSFYFFKGLNILMCI